ncbi:ATP-binding protein [Pseudomonas parafulva]|uniref:histidine kinase n=1 Tax=Pseudomonas parafulva TaxID=157782 RepID=A0ABN4Y0W3_9PSED|nr:ATP-binding protein [Pseudomonas parafulva]AQW70398.1 hypothetical protein B2J77_20280 [Pseudomonas parafulva]WHU42089.1 ATP-binding protein [Pseudomonas fulva]
MQYYRITNGAGVVCDTLPSGYLEFYAGLSEASKKVKIFEIEYRIGIYRKQDVTIYVATCDGDLIKSTRLFFKQVEFLFNCMAGIQKIHSEIAADSRVQANRMIHNLVTLNAHNLQEVYSIIPQEVMEDKKRGGWKDRITECVASDSYDASLSLVRIAKNCLKMKVEISVYNTLSNGDVKLALKRHSIHRILMNVFYVFFPDFTDNEVVVKVGECNEFIECDYETLQVALYHLAENAVKYIRRKSELVVNVSKNSFGQVEVLFRMNSLQIKPEELELIFDEGYSGYYSRKILKSGHGIGLARVKELLGYNKATIEVIPDFSTAAPFSTMQDLIYQDNVFRILFARSSVAVK